MPTFQLHFETLSQFKQIDSGKKTGINLPPKSTWFVAYFVKANEFEKIALK